ncbi:PP2C family protein-serine/threonine phosphatase [Povalibacter sp.]|uniref:PP2C family protein-serine/threonine phosphatase n=1 Tax=Povalibacter sp. TaxID=1962978 RepID=UPI002F3FEDB0
MRHAGRTHPGRRGGQNEDAIGWDESRRLWFVADGMGGHERGAVASAIVKQTLLDAAMTPLAQAVSKAHQNINTVSAPSGGNMGATVVALRIAAGTGEIVWVGDSRAYLWRDDQLSAVTRDHSFLESLRDQQQLTEAQLRGHPNRNLVTQTLGLGTPVPSVKRLPLRRGDWLLLCSDGLNDELEDAEIAATLRNHSSPENATDALIAAALAKGGRDNVSTIVVEYAGRQGASSLLRFGQHLKQWLPALVGVMAAMIVAGIWLWLYGT